MPSVAEKRREFRRLHESGCFVLPNPWDIGSARYLQGLGFKAHCVDQRRLRLHARIAGRRDVARDDVGALE